MNESKTSGDADLEKSENLLSDDKIGKNLQYTLLKEKLKNKYGATFVFTNNNELWHITTNEGELYLCTAEDEYGESYELNQFYELKNGGNRQDLWSVDNYLNKLIKDNEIEDLWHRICSLTWVDRYEIIRERKQELDRQNPKKKGETIKKKGELLLGHFLTLISMVGSSIFIGSKKLIEVIPFLVVTFLCSIIFFFNGRYSRLIESPMPDEKRKAKKWAWGSFACLFFSIVIILYPYWWPKIVGPLPEPTPTSTIITNSQTPIIQTVVVTATPTYTPIATATTQPTPISTPTPNHPNYKIKIGVFKHDSDSCSDTLEVRNEIIENLKELQFSVTEIDINAETVLTGASTPEKRLKYYKEYDVLYMPFGWSCMGDDYKPFFGEIDKILGGKTGILVGDPNIEDVNKPFIIKSFVNGHDFKFSYLPVKPKDLEAIWNGDVGPSHPFSDVFDRTKTDNFPVAGSKSVYFSSNPEKEHPMDVIVSQYGDAPGLIIPNKAAIDKNIRYAIMPGSEYGAPEESIGAEYTERLIKWLANKQ